MVLWPTNMLHFLFSPHRRPHFQHQQAVVSSCLFSFVFLPPNGQKSISAALSVKGVIGKSSCHRPGVFMSLRMIFEQFAARLKRSEESSPVHDVFSVLAHTKLNIVESNVESLLTLYQCAFKWFLSVNELNVLLFRKMLPTHTYYTWSFCLHCKLCQPHWMRHNHCVCLCVSQICQNLFSSRIIEDLEMVHITRFPNLASIGQDRPN